MDYEKYLTFLACPVCQGELEYHHTGQGTFFCPPCDKKYPIVDGIPRFLDVDSEVLGQAKEHWESSPNFQYEAQTPLYSREYYEEQDKWRREEVDPYILDEYRFAQMKGKTIVDIGCGSGWVIKQAAKHGAFPIGVDFTEKAAISSRDALRVYNLKGLVVQADAQKLPLKTNSIDRLYSMGVLHHLPDTEQGIAEAYRVMKPGSTALISLYGRLFFFNPVLFPIASFFLKRLLKAPPVRDGIQHTSNFDEFYRLMDGPTNPIGRWYTDEQLRDIFSQFEIHYCVTSHFPLRYLQVGGISLNKVTPTIIKRLFDRRFGMMKNFQLSKAER